MNWIGTLAGSETFLLLAMGGAVLVLLLSVLRFDFTVLVCFCLLGIVRMEPAPVDGLVMVLLVVGLLTGKLSLKALRGSSFVHLALWIFLVANFASLLASHTLSASLRYLMITVYLVAFTCFVKMYVTSSQAMRRVVIGYLVSAVASASLVALGYLGLRPFSELFLQYGTRAVGAFKDANVFGPFCIPAILLLIDELFYPRMFPRFPLLKILGAVLLTAVVFLSFSRAAWGNLALAVSTYFFLNLNRLLQIRPASLLKRGAITLLAAAAGLPVFRLFLPDRMDLGAFLAWRLSSHDYDVYRFARQREGIEAGLTHVFGTGPGTWDYAHSLYVRTFAEHGLLGLASFLSLMGILVVGTFRRALGEVTKPYGLSARVVVASLVGLVLNSVVIDTIHWRHLWLILALAWVICTHPTTSGAGELRRTLT